MCGRFTLKTPAVEVGRLFQLTLDASFELPPRYNIAPTQRIAAVRSTEVGPRELVMLRWGLVPPWADDLKIGSRMLNARSETVATSRAFRPAFQKRRCLIVADGFYEWRPEPGSARKTPMYMTAEGGEPFAFAGLWEHWKGADGVVVETCTILTTSANEFMRTIHDRMPVIVPPAAHEAWLREKPDEVLRGLLQSGETRTWNARPVSTRVNNVRMDDPQCIQAEKTLF